MLMSDWSSDLCSSDLIAHIVERDWTRLKPDLDGKIHLIVGTADTFSLDGPAPGCRRCSTGSARNLPSASSPAAPISTRSEERRVGKACVGTGRSRLSPTHKKKNTGNTQS